MADTSTPRPGDVLTGAEVRALDLPAGAVVALRVQGATYPWQRRERQTDGQWRPPVQPRAHYELIDLPTPRTADSEEPTT